MRQEVGILLKVGATLCLTLMIASIKALDGAVPTGQVVFFRSAFALVPLGIWLGLQGNVLALVRTRNLPGHLLRGVSGTGGMVFSYLAVAYLPLADAVALGYAAPLVTVVFAAVLLRERVRRHRWLAVLFGLGGVLVMLSSGLSGAGLLGGATPALIGTAFGLAAACCGALSNVQIRHLGATEPPGAIVLYFSLLTAALGLASALFGWVKPNAVQAALLVTCGLVGGLAQILVTVSLRYAPASLLAPFEYLTLVWASAIGFCLSGDLPKGSVLAGAAIVAGSGLFAAWRDRVRTPETREGPGSMERPACPPERRPSPVTFAAGCPTKGES